MGDAVPQTPGDLPLSTGVDTFACLFQGRRTMRIACAEDKATQGCDPRADASPVWMAA